MAVCMSEYLPDQQDVNDFIKPIVLTLIAVVLSLAIVYSFVKYTNGCTTFRYKRAKNTKNNSQVHVQELKLSYFFESCDDESVFIRKPSLCRSDISENKRYDTYLPPNRSSNKRKSRKSKLNRAEPVPKGYI